MAKIQVDDNLLVALVHSSTALYDRTSSQYKDAVLKDQAWTTISKTLNLPKVVCKSRWTILRQRYSRIKRQINQNKVCDGRRRSTVWKLFENLQFLDEHIVSRSRHPKSKIPPSGDGEDVKPSRPQLDAEIERHFLAKGGFKFGPETKFSLPVSPASEASAPSPTSTTVNAAATPPIPKQEMKIAEQSFTTRQGDASFGDFITFELSSFRNEYNKDRAKQIIVNIIYKYKNECKNLND